MIHRRRFFFLCKPQPEWFWYPLYRNLVQLQHYTEEIRPRLILCNLSDRQRPPTRLSGHPVSAERVARQELQTHHERSATGSLGEPFSHTRSPQWVLHFPLTWSVSSQALFNLGRRGACIWQQYLHFGGKELPVLPEDKFLLMHAPLIHLS